MIEPYRYEPPEHILTRSSGTSAEPYRYEPPDHIVSRRYEPEQKSYRYEPPPYVVSRQRSGRYDVPSDLTNMAPPGDLLGRLIQVESGGDPKAVNPTSGAMGLAQAMPATARDPGYGVAPLRDPFNPTESTRFARDYLGAMLREFQGNTVAALAAYNWGPGNVKRWLKRGGNPTELPAETQKYIRAIMG